MARTKTITSDFQDFVKYAKFYIKEFGLTDYDVDFIHKDLKDEDDPLCNSQAGCKMAHNGKWATILLNKDFSNDVTERNIHLAALHEVLHLLLFDYTYAARCRFGIQEDELNSLEHAVVARLENFIMRGDK